MFYSPHDIQQVIVFGYGTLNFDILVLIRSSDIRQLGMRYNLSLTRHWRGSSTCNAKRFERWAPTDTTNRDLWGRSIPGPLHYGKSLLRRNSCLPYAVVSSLVPIQPPIQSDSVTPGLGKESRRPENLRGWEPTSTQDQEKTSRNGESFDGTRQYAAGRMGCPEGYDHAVWDWGLKWPNGALQTNKVLVRTGLI
jgi:hypothetical protein